MVDTRSRRAGKSVRMVKQIALLFFSLVGEFAMRKHDSTTARFDALHLFTPIGMIAMEQSVAKCSFHPCLQVETKKTETIKDRSVSVHEICR